MTPEQKKYLEQGGVLTNGNIPTQIAPTGSPTVPINSSLLEPVSQLPYVNPNPVPVPSITGLSTDVTQLTAPEVKATDLTSRLQELNKQLVGESTFRTQQEDTAGIQGLQKTQQDLANQLKAVQSEAKAIPLQLQQEATGRGITAGGLAPLQTARLRTNAIQALTVSSLLEASKGNLFLAQQQAERATEAKFAPVREQIEVANRNLQLILQSPEYTLADKNRAIAQQAIQETRKREINKQEENSKIAQALAATAVKNNPGNQAALYGAQSVSSLDPSSPNYLAKVYGLVGQFQTDPIQTQKDLTDLEYKQAQIDSIESDTQLSKAKFEEDKLRYGLETALKEQKKVAEEKAAEVAASGADTLKQNALTTVSDLLTTFDAGQGTSAVGGNVLNRLGFIGDWLGTGTNRSNFLVKFNNLKALLSLDNVKYLKGQGQISDSERRILEQASAKLDRSQSEGEFRKSLADIQKGLSGIPGDLAAKVASKGYNYAKMKSDGLSDEEIKKSLGI